ncbi:MAG: CHAP domain-containing protein [Lachnospiraceae bacterium]|nr:CHAP domain-containing protein [Lachnospiraceae bacterium]MCM1232077.1 CHAP domain-containing protein [Ruminococcus flavefaciens]
MTLLEFVQRHIKTRVDFDGAYGAQCVDLFRQYCKDVLGIPHTGAVAGAKDLVERYGDLPKEREHFALIKDRRNALRGDAAVWGATKGNPYGHVAIVLEARPDVLTVFEQDGFEQDGAKLAERSMGGVIGYLRKYPE